MPSLLTTHQADFLRQQYRHKTRKEVTIALNLEFGLNLKQTQVVAYIKNHKLQSGRTGHFKKGAIPWSAQAPGRMKANKSSFKTGHQPANLKAIGHERIDQNGYIWIKVAEKNPYTPAKTSYRQKHRWLWEQHHGAIPTGMMVCLKDGNRQNCVLENLELLTLAESGYLTSTGMRNIPALNQTTRLIAKVAMTTKQKGQANG